jgi:hypothetical protein
MYYIFGFMTGIHVYESAQVDRFEKVLNVDVVDHICRPEARGSKMELSTEIMLLRI